MNSSLRTGDGAAHLRELRRAMHQYNMLSGRFVHHLVTEGDEHSSVVKAENRLLQAARNLIDWDDQR